MPENILQYHLVRIMPENTLRFYLSKRIHNGRWYAAKMTEYLADDGTQNFRSWKIAAGDDNLLCLATCKAEMHARLDADPDITAVSPMFDTAAKALEWFDQHADERMAIRGPRDLIRQVIK